MSYHISRRKMKTFIQTAFPNLLEAHRRDIGKTTQDYFNYAAEEFETTRKTIVNWYSAMTSPKGYDLAFVLLYLQKEIGFADNGKPVFIDKCSTIDGSDKQETGISIVANRRG